MIIMHYYFIAWLMCSSHFVKWECIGNCCTSPSSCIESHAFLIDSLTCRDVYRWTLGGAVAPILFFFFVWPEKLHNQYKPVIAGLERQSSSVTWIERKEFQLYFVADIQLTHQAALPQKHCVVLLVYLLIIYLLAPKYQVQQWRLAFHQNTALCQERRD